jgi:hypothetical protein
MLISIIRTAVGQLSSSFVCAVHLLHGYKSTGLNFQVAISNPPDPRPQHSLILLSISELSS